MNARILIADDHELVRQGIRRVLEDHPGWQVVGEASNGREALQLTSELLPDVLVLDISMPEMNGLDVIQEALALSRRTKILVVSIHDSERLIQDVLAAGARGYLLKSDAASDLKAAVEAVLSGKSFYTAKVSEVLVRTLSRGGASAVDTAGGLTTREREVVQLVAEGKANKDIAALLNISVRTVETHRSNVMQKLELHSLPDLIRYAIRNHLIAGPSDL